MNIRGQLSGIANTLAIFLFFSLCVASENASKEEEQGQKERETRRDRLSGGNRVRIRKLSRARIRQKMYRLFLSRIVISSEIPHLCAFLFLFFFEREEEIICAIRGFHVDHFHPPEKILSICFFPKEGTLYLR